MDLALWKDFRWRRAGAAFLHLGPRWIIEYGVAARQVRAAGHDKTSKAAGREELTVGPADGCRQRGSWCRAARTMIKNLFPGQDIQVRFATRQMARLAGLQAGILPKLKPSHVGNTGPVRPRRHHHTDERHGGRK